uniref:uncharacterized protein LOC124064161 isoform X2 n=1 Tax=Scatophagus argus TaxID=75038 RepID=UPI001ED8103A|nr:uncharacterized protein LOC124064161 isoform X2 [Scatophagus argus]
MAHWNKLCCVLLVALTVASQEITWYGPVHAGQIVTFTCSSSCSTKCIYTWSFLGRTVNGSTLTWTPDGRDSMVELHCNILDPGTGVSNTMSINVEIHNRLSVQISSPNTVPSLNKSLDLVCYCDTVVYVLDPPLLVYQVVWYKDGQKVTLRENMQLPDNATLHFDSLLPSDAGFYQCEAYTIMSRRRRLFSLGYLLSFEPWNVSISGPDIVFPGRQSKFTCLARCSLNVDCAVKWQFRSGFPIGTHLSVYENELRWTPSIPGTFQNFTCVAENVATRRSAEATKMVEVKDGSEAVQFSGLFVMIFSLGQLLLFDS